MDNIVAGQFEDFAHAEAAMRELRLDRIDPAEVAHIVLGAAGRDDGFPVGGDGTWADFDHVSPPRWILPPTQAAASTTAEQAGA